MARVLGLAAVPATLLTLGGIFCPETPNSLIERGKREQGRQILTKIRATQSQCRVRGYGGGL